MITGTLTDEEFVPEIGWKFFGQMERGRWFALNVPIAEISSMLAFGITGKSCLTGWQCQARATTTFDGHSSLNPETSKAMAKYPS